MTVHLDPLVAILAAELRRTVEGGETVNDAAERLLAALVEGGYRVDVDRTPTVAPEHLAPPTVADGLDAGSRDSTGQTRWRLSYRDGAVFADLPGVPIDSVLVNGQHYAPAPEPEWRPFVVRDGIDGPAVNAMTDPTEQTPTVDLVATVLGGPALWDDYSEERREVWRAKAREVVAALSGRLLPEGGETREERGFWNPNTGEVQGWWSYSEQGYKAPDRRRTVMSWLDGRAYFGPWEPAA